MDTKTIFIEIETIFIAGKNRWEYHYPAIENAI